MKKRISIPVCILLIVLCCTITFQVTYIFAFWNRSSNSRVGYYNDKLAAIDRIYRENFVGEIDDDALTDALINGYIAGVGEKYGY